MKEKPGGSNLTRGGPVVAGVLAATMILDACSVENGPCANDRAAWENVAVPTGMPV